MRVKENNKATQLNPSNSWQKGAGCILRKLTHPSAQTTDPFFCFLNTPLKHRKATGQFACPLRLCVS